MINVLSVFKRVSDTILFQIIIYGEIGYFRNNDVAIDDFNYTPTPCAAPLSTYVLQKRH